MIDAKATMAVFRAHKNIWEHSSGTISQMQDPEPMDLWNIDGETDMKVKKMRIAQQLGIYSENIRVCLFPFSWYRNYFIMTVFEDRTNHFQEQK